MTISYVGIGSTDTDVNAALTPSMVAGVADDDLLLIEASIRNSGTGTVDLDALNAAGWATIFDLGNFAMVGRYYAAGVVAPTVDFVGGAAGADTQAAMVAFRGVAPSLDLIEVVTQTNGSAANIAYPAADVPRDDCAVLIAAWKQDDASSITMPGGFTGAVNSFVTAGDDSSLRLGYSIQTAEADIGSGSLTVTGGAAAISKSAVLVLRPAAAIATDEQDVYPPRVLVSITGLAGDELIDLYRVVGGVRTAVRGGSDFATDVSFLALDAELPFGVPVYYSADVDSVEYTTSTVTYDLPNGATLSKPAFTDAIQGLSAEAAILAWPGKVYDRQASVFRLASGDTAVVSGPMGTFQSTLELFVETTASLENLQVLLRQATGNTIQIRQGGSYDGVDSYVNVLSHEETRFSQDGSDERRIVTLQVVEVQPWSFDLVAQGYTYADLETVYDSLTYSDLQGDYATYLALAQAELTA